MKKLTALMLAVFSVLTLIGCTPSTPTAHVSEQEDSQAVESVAKKQYLDQTKVRVFDWKCDIPLNTIKHFSGNPTEGCFLTEDNSLYWYDSKDTYEQTGKCYYKIETDLQILDFCYDYALNSLHVLTTDYKTYAYTKKEPTFKQEKNDFGSEVKAIAEQNHILSWSSFRTDTVWYINDINEIYCVTQGLESYKTETKTQKIGTLPMHVKVADDSKGVVVKTDNAFYCFTSYEEGFEFNAEATAVYDNISFIDSRVVIYKSDPDHIYDHKLIYDANFVYD